MSPRNVAARTYRCPVAPRAHSPFPVDPADVPDGAVRFIRRTLLRHGIEGPSGDTGDDYLERVIVAGLIAVLADSGALEEVSLVVSRYTAATGAVVAVQAR